MQHSPVTQIGRCLFPILAGPNGLNFFGDTNGYLGVTQAKKFEYFLPIFFNYFPPGNDGPFSLFFLFLLLVSKQRILTYTHQNGLVKLIIFGNMTIEESLEKFVALFNIKFMLFQFMETTHHVLFHNQLPSNGKQS